LWQRRFGSSRDVIGQTIRIARAPFVVVGVIPPGPRDLSIGWGDVWTPIHWYNMQQNRATGYRARYLRVLGRVKPGVTLAQAQSRMDLLQSQLEQEASSVAAGYSAKVVSLDEALVGRFRTMLLVLLGAVGFVLLTASANIANLMLARGAAREKDLAIRIALGAGRARLALELLAESGVLSLLGAGLGLVLAYGGLWLLKYSLAAHVPRIADAGLKPAVLLFTLILAAVSVCFFSLAPIVLQGRSNVHETLKQAGRSGAGGVRRQKVRTLLIAAEFAFAALLLSGAGLLLKSFAHLLRVDAGFALAGRTTDDVISCRPTSIRTPPGAPRSIATSGEANPARARPFAELERRTSEIPGAISATLTTLLPLRHDPNPWAMHIEGKPAPPTSTGGVWWSGANQ
jgi:putative ABC transport system permease protein